MKQNVMLTIASLLSILFPYKIREELLVIRPQLQIGPIWLQPPGFPPFAKNHPMPADRNSGPARKLP
jgi:hypothetical protein